MIFADPNAMPDISPVVEPTVMMPAPSALLQVPPGSASLSTVPAVMHMVFDPSMSVGNASTYTFVVVAQPVGRV